MTDGTHPWKITDVLMRLLTPPHRERLRTLARSITKDDGAAELIVNDAISKCARMANPDKVKPEKLLAYLKMMVRNKSFDWYRDTRRQRAYFGLHHDLSARSTLSEVFSREAVRLLETEIEKLPEHFREVVKLRIVDELPYDQIALKLQISTGTVMSRFFRGKQLLWRWVDYARAE